MNDIKITLKAMSEIVDAAHRDISIAERCALRAGLDTFIEEIKQECRDRFGDVDGYLSEKLFKLKWSVDANPGLISRMAIARASTARGRWDRWI